jgi:light-harvesting protein B-800-850 alpha chain
LTMNTTWVKGFLNGGAKVVATAPADAAAKK